MCNEYVKEIREEKLHLKLTNKEIGKMYNVGEAAISKIINFKRWKHVK
jgi:hypothetical protein